MGNLLDLRGAMKAAMASAMPTRVVTRSYQDFSQRAPADLEAGIVTILGAGEKDYANYVGREAQLGTVPMVVVGQLQISEATLKADGAEAVEDAEDLLVEEIKAFVANPGDALLGGIRMLGFRQSGQIEAPYGWVACDIEVLT